MEREGSSPCSQELAAGPILSQMNSTDTPKLHIRKIYINIHHHHMALQPNSGPGLPFRVS
jgi:hypothetical protein